MADTQPRCFLTQIPIELQSMIINNLETFEKHHLRLTSHHFQQILPLYIRAEIKHSADSHSRSCDETWKFCESCTVVKPRSKFSMHDRYYFEHLRTGDIALHKPKTQRELFRYEFTSVREYLWNKIFIGNCNSVRMICLECDLSGGEKPALWSLGIWSHWNDDEPKYHMYCAGCNSLEAGDRTIMVKKDSQCYCEPCWEAIEDAIDEQKQD